MRPGLIRSPRRGMETAENRRLTPAHRPKPFAGLPGRITRLRIALVALMWGFAAMNRPEYIGIGLVLAGLTDILDGLAARLLDQESESGGRLDSIADCLVFLSALVWIAVFRPEILAAHVVAVTAALLINLGSLLLGWFKFRRFANLHLYSSKAAATAVYGFLIHTFLVGYNDPLFYIAIGAYVLSSVESLALQLSRSAVDEKAGSVLSG